MSLHSNSLEGRRALPMPRTSWLWVAALGALVLRFVLAAKLPLSGDEALFVAWSRALDYGYYDHPPMAAWWIAASRALLGESEWAVRMPAVLLPLAVGGLIWSAWSPVDRARAAWAVLFYWLTPFSWLVSLMATDTPLIFWAAASVATLARAEQLAQRNETTGGSGLPWAWYALSGLCIGAAFLSKYFAVLLGVAYLVYFGGWARRRWPGLVVLVACAIPAVVVNIVWNLHHCWTNIMFNLVNRNQGSGLGWQDPLMFLVMMLYLLGPALLWLGWQSRRASGLVLRQQPLLACVALVPLACFAWVSLRKEIGLHWVMAFYPFVLALLAWAAPAERLRQALVGMVAFLGLHLAALAVLVALPLSTWQGMSVYPRIVNALEARAIVQAFDAPGVVLGASSYGSGSIYGYAAGRHVPVIGPGSVHARQDDLNVDYRALQGRTLRVVQVGEPDLAEYRPYFESVRLLSTEVHGARIYAVEGRGFNYEAYRATVLYAVNARYYAFPDWLPVLDCPFCQRLCGQARCLPGAQAESAQQR